LLKARQKEVTKTASLSPLAPLWERAWREGNPKEVIKPVSINLSPHVFSSKKNINLPPFQAMVPGGTTGEGFKEE